MRQQRAAAPPGVNGNGADHNGAAHTLAQSTATSSRLSREECVMHIRLAGQKSVERIIQQGYWLERASRDLKGEFEKMLNEDLRLSDGKARKLRAIARNPVLAHRSNWNALPPCWTTLYQLSLIRPFKRLEALIEEGQVHAGLQYEKARELAERKSSARSTPQR
jgi:hypothetical protein